MMRAGVESEVTAPTIRAESSTPTEDAYAERSLRRGTDSLPDREGEGHAPAPPQLDVVGLRRYAWEIGSRRAHDAHVCPDTYVNLCAVSPGEAFVVWRVQPSWIESTSARRRDHWNGSRFVVRLYDVSFLEFNGMNAHRLRDIAIDGLSGQRLVAFPLAGTTQLAEVGFVLRNGEFIAAARSTATAFPSPTVSSHHDDAALYVDDRLAPEPVPSPWESTSYVRERSKPRLRRDLRIAMLSFEAEAVGHAGPVATFVTSLGSELHAQGQEVHAFVPAHEDFQADAECAGVAYHPLVLGPTSGPIDTALAFARSLETCLRGLPPFDYFHMQEWMTALVPWMGTRPATLALTSIEPTRRNGTAATEMSMEIEKTERELARAAECLIVPTWLHARAATDLGADSAHIHPFPMEGRPVDEWETPLDHGRVKADLGLHPFDRVLLFVGPLEWAAGPDLLIEALPTVLSRTPNVGLVFAGEGGMRGHLVGRGNQLGVGHAIRVLGHVERARLVPLLRASEALLMPARHRLAQDHAVAELARRASRPVLTTHGGPAYLIRHEEDGLLVYDNPPSLVWGMSRLLDDPRHSEQMGRTGGRQGEGASWSGLAQSYADLCARTFPELSETGLVTASSSERARGQR